MTSNAALSLRDVSVVYDGRRVLGPLDLSVDAADRWVVLGPNGSGKTTLVRIISLVQYPSTGEVSILGQRWGSTDIRALRALIGMSGAAMADQLRPGITAQEIVVSARHGALETWWHDYDETDTAHARAQLARFDVDHLASHPFVTLSSGERQRVLLARTYANDPQVVVLDEPTAGLDLGGREDLVGRLAALAGDVEQPPIIYITHHLEEIPPGFTHALLLRDGRPLAAGPIDEVVTSASVSACFGVAIEVTRTGSRWSARAV